MLDLKKKSLEIIESNQHISGAYVACPNFDTYKYCWLRDGSFIAHSIDLWGGYDSAEKFFQWVNNTILKQESRVDRLLEKLSNKEELKSSDFLPTRYTLEGNETLDDWPNFQIDGYGTWLWALCEHIKLKGDTQLINKYDSSIKITVEYLLNFWNLPNYDCWEENGDKIHPATLACIYGGLSEISQFIQDGRIAEILRKIKEYILDKCIVDGRLSKYEGSGSIDASLLWTVIPFKVFECEDEIIVKTVEEIEKRLCHNGGVHRYPEDTYYGGGEWLLLSCWLGLYYAETKQLEKAKAILNWVEAQTCENGEMPEQVLHHVNDPGYIEKWENLWGKVATPLLWSHAMYLTLLYEICHGSK